MMKDWIGCMAFLLSVSIWIRTIWRDKREPRRQEILSLLRELEIAVGQLGDEVEAHLLWTKGRLDKDLIYRQLRKPKALLEKLCAKRLNDSESNKLRAAYQTWYEILTSDPFPLQKQSGRLKSGDMGLRARRDKETQLTDLMDQLCRSQR